MWDKSGEGVKEEITKQKEKNMKKIVIMLLMLMPMVGANATTMCAANDTVAVVLDPSIGLNSNSYDAESGRWLTWGSYGTVHGISACVNVGQGKSRGNTVARLTDTNNNETNLVVGSERYGGYCWCRMTHPAVSLWTFLNGYGSASNCASGCARDCSSNLRAVSSFREGLFGSVRN